MKTKLKDIIRDRSDWAEIQAGRVGPFPVNFAHHPTDNEWTDRPRSREIREAAGRGFKVLAGAEREELLEASQRRDLLIDEVRSLRLKIRVWRNHHDAAAETVRVYCASDDPENARHFLESGIGCERLADEAEQKYLVPLVAELEILEAWILAAVSETPKDGASGGTINSKKSTDEN